MIITKNNKVYSVEEKKTKWVVSAEDGALSVSYDVPKNNCKTPEELKEYVISNDLF